MASPFGLDLALLLRSGDYSDMTLVCDGQEFKVHKLVMCSLSPVLAAAMKEPFEASIAYLSFGRGRRLTHEQEAKTGVIQIKDFEAETVAQMVDFLYTGDYKVQTPAEEENTQMADGDEATPRHIDTDWALAQHIRVNAIADYYNIARLTEKSTSNISDVIQTHSDPETLLEAASLALSMTGDKTMQHVMAGAVSGQLDAVLADERHAEPLAVLVNDFGVSILRHQAEEQKTLRAAVEKLEKSLSTSEAKCGRLIENFETCRVRLETLAKCTNTGHCQAQFNCVLNKTGQPWEPRYTVRCGNCARRFS